VLSEPELIRINGALATAMCLPVPAPDKPKEPTDDSEKIMLQAERDAYKRLYETVLEQFVKVKFDYDVSRKQEEIKVEEPKIEIPEEITEIEPDPEPAPQKVFTPEIVNVNTASAQEISNKTGLALKDAYAITGYRNKNGLFVELEELLEVSRISKPKFEKFKGLFTLGESETEVPEESEAPEEPCEDESELEVTVEKVNVNEANIYDLMRAGFGKSESARIVRWVKKYGPFANLDDLTKVDGVTGKSLRKIRDNLEV
jgi:competence ComEA-like helix-hairpin-helix protein